VTAQAYPALTSRQVSGQPGAVLRAAKWVAKLRRLKTDERLLVMRVNLEAGHGGKSGRFEHLHEVAEEYAFILDQARPVGK